MDHSVLELLVDNLFRLNETEESDRQGVFHIMGTAIFSCISPLIGIIGVFENVIGFDPELSEKLVTGTKIMNWLLDRIQLKTHDENRSYAAEFLSILLQNSPANRQAFGDRDGVESVLKVLSVSGHSSALRLHCMYIGMKQFRKRDPVDADEAEFMENLFDALCSALSEPKIKSLFLASEGVDLMLLMMK